MRGPNRLIATSLAFLLATGNIAIVAQHANPVANRDAVIANDAPAIPTVSARYVVRIAWDERVRLPEMTHFILSQREIKDSARVCLNLEKPPQFSAQTDRREDGVVDLTLSVAVDPRMRDVRLGAAEFVEEIIAALPDWLRARQFSFISEIEQSRDRLNDSHSEVQFKRKEVAELRARLRKQTGRADAPEKWGEAISSLEQERQKLTLDAAGQQARRRAIEETIATITKRAEQRAEDDEIAQELAKIVALREEELLRSRQLVATGRMSETDIANIGAKVAEARAKLLERRELSARSAGGELLGEFNRELLTLSINAAENEARLKLIQETLDRFHQSTADVDRLKLAEKDLTVREAAERSAGDQVSRIEEKYRNLRAPTIGVIQSSYQTLEQWTKENAQPK